MALQFQSKQDQAIDDQSLSVVRLFIHDLRLLNLFHHIWDRSVDRRTHAFEGNARTHQKIPVSILSDFNGTKIDDSLDNLYTY